MRPSVSPSAIDARWLSLLGDRVAIALLAIYLLLLYTLVPLELPSGQLVPGFWVLPVMFVYILLFGFRVYKSDFRFVTTILLIAVMSMVWAGEYDAYKGRAESIVLLLAALANGVVFLQVVDRLSHRTLTTVLMYITIGIMIGTVLEVSGVIRYLSDAFRVWAFSSSYSSLEPDSSHVRDLALVGFIRPNLFTSETSNLAKGFLVFSNAWILSTYSRRRFVLALLANILMLALTGSMVILVSLVSAVVIALLVEKNWRYIFAIVAICVVGLFVILMSMHNIVEGVVSRFGNVSDSLRGSHVVTSETLRLVNPYITLVDVLREAPLFGVGIGGTDKITDYSSMRYPVSMAVGNNGFANLFIYFGLMGSALLIVGVAGYLKQKNIDDRFMLAVLMIGLLHTMGDTWTIRAWAYFFLYVAVLRKKREIAPCCM